MVSSSIKNHSDMKRKKPLKKALRNGYPNVFCRRSGNSLNVGKGYDNKPVVIINTSGCHYSGVGYRDVQLEGRDVGTARIMPREA